MTSVNSKDYTSSMYFLCSVYTNNKQKTIFITSIPLFLSAYEHLFPILFCCLVTKYCQTHMNISSLSYFVVQSLSTVRLCDPMDCSPPGSSVHEISQARVLECVSFPSPGDLPGSGIKPTYSALAGGFFAAESPGKPLPYFILVLLIIGIIYW